LGFVLCGIEDQAQDAKRRFEKLVACIGSVVGVVQMSS